MTRDHLERRKRTLFRWMYEFTQRHCRDCARSGCACKDTICAHVLQQAEKGGRSFTPTRHPLRCIGPAGCIVPPETRETCTLFICDKAKAEPDFPHATYARLSALCERVQWRLMQLDAGPGQG